MKPALIRQSLAVTIVLAGLSVAAMNAFAAGDEGLVVEIHGGTATFDAATNVPAINIHGASAALEGRARIRQSADGLVIDQLAATLPIRTLNTGIGLRDEHMRKYVFTTPEGLLTDVRFVAERMVCSGSRRDKTCKLAGDLIIRDTPRPFAIGLTVSDEGTSFHASGHGVVRLSAYGISPPSQLGVRASDEVVLHVNFVAKKIEERIARASR